MIRPDKRRLIMKAAEQLFTTRRFHEITTDDIAAAATVGKGTIYRYFRDKEDLFFQTATSGFDELCNLVRRHTDGRSCFQEQLLAIGGQIRGFFESRHQLFCMMHADDARMVRGTMRERWQAHRKKLVTAVATVIERGAAEGKVRSDVPPEVLATFLLGMLRTQARELSDSPRSARRLEVVVELFSHGARPRSTPARTSGRRAVARRAL
jgi:AcrR family transcriptional regulator